jgi:TonB family protein
MSTLGLTVFSQIENKIGKDSLAVEEMVMCLESAPEFYGGVDSLWSFIESNLDFKILNYSCHQGKVLVSFDIDTTGEVINIQTNPNHTQRQEWLVNDSLIENEIKRVIKLLPDWKPGLQRNKPIRVKYCLLINIPYTDYKCKSLDNPTAAYWKVDKYARFRYKGEKETKKSIEKFIGKNGIWPSQDDCAGHVHVRVIINEQGELSDFVILRGLDGCRGFNEEALRLVGIMPNWKPAKINGKPVKAYTVIPISFMLR